MLPYLHLSVDAIKDTKTKREDDVAILAFPLTLSCPIGISSFVNDLRLEVAEARGIRLDLLSS